ncbi:hypothetical protein C6558_37930 [Ensifer sp. NM-2]|uniref:hypothetical protein n=1 Tax=Ensifer sp. NM-2 TaxID=2109730 RepID=UPI000D1176F0|nr:hypothetical protein [Ensifer sp. NM-2]PSS59514.1 hypothetical protein C6558_37930 [Ensifer sp. NM-2]
MTSSGSPYQLRQLDKDNIPNTSGVEGGGEALPVSPETGGRKVFRAKDGDRLPILRRSASSVLGRMSGLVNANHGGRKGGLLTFVGLVLFPSLVVLLYYLFVASDVYVSEVKLTVRESYDSDSVSNPVGSNALSSIVGKLGIRGSGSTAQDSMIILDYLKSRSVIADIGGRVTLEKIYAHSDVDMFSRLGASRDMEELWAYWKEHVTTYVDTASNILTLRVRAFRANDAHWLAEELTRQSEVLINRISQRNREDALTRARGEVDRSMSELAAVRSDIVSFQRKNNALDPQATAKQIMELISNLTLKRIELESEISASQRVGASDRPGDKYQKSVLNVINEQISDLQSRLASSSSQSLSDQLKDFELLKLKEQFAAQLYGISRSSFEEARRNLNNQQLYVVVIVPSMRPDLALYPKPVEEAAVVFLGLLIVWSIGFLLFATIRDSSN